MKSSMMIALLGLSVATAQAQDSKDPCAYVEAAKNFEPGQHGKLLASYMNYSPSPGNHGVGAHVERDDDQFGVCRIFADGAVITSFGCAGEDHVTKEKIVHSQTIHSLKSAISDSKQTDPSVLLNSFKENFDELDVNGPTPLTMLAVISPGKEAAVKKASELHKLMMQICPLDNEPLHRKIVK